MSTSLVPPDYDLTLYEGDSVSFSFRARSRTSTGGPGPYYDLTGCTPKAQIRFSEDDETVVAEFTAVLGDQTDSDEKGMVKLSLTSAQITDWAAEEAVWDAQVTWPDGRVQTFLKGKVTVVKEVTR